MYQLTKFDSILKLTDNSVIPKDENNTDYIDYLIWVQNGGLVNPVPPMTKEEINQGVLSQIDSLERQYLMPRITREATILQLEEWALSQGCPLDQFRIANKGYRGLKELDETIQQLRSQLIP